MLTERERKILQDICEKMSDDNPGLRYDRQLSDASDDELLSLIHKNYLYGDGWPFCIGVTPVARHEVRPSNRPQPVLNRMESAITEALRKRSPLTTERLAEVAGYPPNRSFKQTLASLTRQGLLVNPNDHQGYRLAD